MFVLDSAALCSDNGLWGPICHRQAGVWFETEDSFQHVEAASFVIEGEPDWSTSVLCGEGHSAQLWCEVFVHGVSAFLHTGSAGVVLAPSIRLHGERWDDVPVSHICTMTNQTQALVHRGSLPVFPSGLVIVRLF